MKMNTDLSVKEALEIGKAMPYAMFTHLSKVTLGKTPTVVSLDELIEARFFGGNGEIHIFTENGEQKAVHITDEENDSRFPPIDREYTLLSNFGKKLTVRQYIDFDNEEQAYIKAVRLLGWEA
ncbi:hypothetical protein [Frisingicoccus sp.]|uniref:hypothetical protein n=1 Tax=Frisingicoccus sp. TaxID=1918627 RepID=UPI0025C19458|nr:hypothetical protein [Frisingicoccus sp.]